MFSMSKSNPFATGQPFRDEAAPLESERPRGFFNGPGTSSTSDLATVAPAIVATTSWGEEGQLSTGA